MRYSNWFTTGKWYALVTMSTNLLKHSSWLVLLVDGIPLTLGLYSLELWRSTN